MTTPVNDDVKEYRRVRLRSDSQTAHLQDLDVHQTLCGIRWGSFDEANRGSSLCTKCKMELRERTAKEKMA